jgi:two-component system, sensor histidine kinase LadS
VIRHLSILDTKSNSIIVFGINLFFAAVFFYTLSNVSFAVEKPKIFIPAGDGIQSLSASDVQMEFLEDTDGTYTIDQVASGQAGVFRPLVIKNYNFSYKKRAFWIRFTADLSRYNDLYWFLMQNYEHVGILTVFYPDISSGFHAIEFIEDVVPGHRLFNIHNYLFKIPTPKNNPTTYYVRFVPDGHALNIDLLWSSTKAIVEYISNTQMEFGLFFGGLLVMWIYNCVLFLYLRNRIYFYYLYYLGAFIVTFFYINGLAPLVFRLSLLDEKIFAACAYAAVHGMILFARHFLDLKKSIRWLDNYLIVFQWILFSGGLLCFFLPRGTPFIGINYLILFVIPALVIGGTIRCYQGYQPAYLYFSGWVVFGTGLALQALKTIGILPAIFLTNYAIQVASVWESIVFALALANRLRLLEKEETAKSKQLMLKLEQAVEMEKMAVQQKTIFISAVNHELRTPLQSMTGSIEVLSIMAKSSPMEKFVEKIKRASEQIVAQMRDIGEYSRLEAGVLTVRKTNFSLLNLLSGVVDDFSKMAKDRGIFLFLKNIESDVVIAADYDRIRQILNNLVSNAIKFTESGTVTIEWSIEVSQKSNNLTDSAWLSIYVIDTGMGISAENLPKIFDTFAQLESKNKTLGTGLGLAIVKRIVELLNATITVESQIGKGSRFIVRIPVEQ